MTKKSITLAGLLLIILAIVIVINLDAAGSRPRAAAGLNLETARATSASRTAGSGVSGKALFVNSKDVHALKGVASNVGAVELSGASLNLLKA
jgi:hypothetical protein